MYYSKHGRSKNVCAPPSPEGHGCQTVPRRCRLHRLQTPVPPRSLGNHSNRPSSQWWTHAAWCRWPTALCGRTSNTHTHCCFKEKSIFLSLSFTCMQTHYRDTESLTVINTQSYNTLHKENKTWQCKYKTHTEQLENPGCSCVLEK